MPRVNVNLPAAPPRSYAVEIEAGSLAQIGARLRALGGAARVCVVQDAVIAGNHGQTLHASLREAGFDVSTHSLHADEQSKSLDTVRAIYEAMLAAKLDRSSWVVALGGGIIGDSAGFAAATYMRGLPLVHVPTTLLAMVDAAIGGKTGVNMALGLELIKNLIGEFWQPRAVFIDPLTLSTLDDRHLRCGLAECIKHAMIERSGQRSAVSDQSLMDFLTRHTHALLEKDAAILTDLIARSASIKARIVERDERESLDDTTDPLRGGGGGGRAALNLGHTFAHAIESFPQLNLLHGEAVALGLIAAMRCAILTQRMTEAHAFPIWKLIHDCGLPRRLPQAIPTQQLVNAMQRDKKVVSGSLRLVLPMGEGGVVVANDVPAAVIHAAWAEIAAA